MFYLLLETHKFGFHSVFFYYIKSFKTYELTLLVKKMYHLNTIIYVILKYYNIVY